tara:strand:- start:2065 stop:2298 length:234 start_codon:yes stop_codon:yes gene_type:complete
MGYENLKAQMQGFNLTTMQKADALIEFNSMLEKLDKLEELNKEVQKVWNEDGDSGEIQKRTPIAWQRVIRISNEIKN